MFEDFGLSPESNTLDDFVATAKAIEQCGKTKTYYEAMKCNMQSNTSTTRATPKPAPPFCQPTAVHNVGQHSTPMKLPRFSRPSPRTTINKAKPVGQNDPHAAITRNRVGIPRKCIPMKTGNGGGHLLQLRKEGPLLPQLYQPTKTKEGLRMSSSLNRDWRRRREPR